MNKLAYISDLVFELHSHTVLRAAKDQAINYSKGQTVHVMFLRDSLKTSNSIYRVQKYRRSPSSSPGIFFVFSLDRVRMGAMQGRRLGYAVK